MSVKPTIEAVGLADYLALGVDVLSLSPPGTLSREVPRQVADEARRRAFSAFVALIIGIVIIIIRSLFEDLRFAGRRCGLFATRFALHGLRVSPGGVRPVGLACTTKM